MPYIPVPLFKFQHKESSQESAQKNTAKAEKDPYSKNSLARYLIKSNTEEQEYKRAKEAEERKRKAQEIAIALKETLEEFERANPVTVTNSAVMREQQIREHVTEEMIRCDENESCAGNDCPLFKIEVILGLRQPELAPGEYL